MLLATNANAQVGRDDLPDEVVYKGLRFKVNTAFVSVNGGFSSNLSKPLDFPYNHFGIDYRHPLKKKEDKYNVISGGVLSYGDNKQLRLYNFHAEYGVRYPKKKSNTLLAIGPCINRGYIPADSSKYSGYFTVGLYAEAEWVYKLYYDIGLGPSVYITYDFNRPVYGIRLTLYLSNSYMGKSKNEKDSD